MPQCQFPVFAVFVFQKSYRENILRIGQNKRQSSFFPKRDGVQSRDRGVLKGGHTMPWCGPPCGRAGLWCGPLAHTLRRPFRLYILLGEENLSPNQFPQNMLQAATVIDARSGGSRSSSRHPAGEGNHNRRPPSSPRLPLEWCVSSLPWTTGP
jgi:hypothetical protein